MLFLVLVLLGWPFSQPAHALIIANNSDLDYEVTLECPVLLDSVLRSVPARTRLTLEDFYTFPAGTRIPRYFNLYVQSNASDVVEERTFLEVNTYVALLGPKPHFKVHFEPDTSDEAKVPTLVMIGRVERFVRESPVLWNRLLKARRNFAIFRRTSLQFLDLSPSKDEGLRVILSQMIDSEETLSREELLSISKPVLDEIFLKPVKYPEFGYLGKLDRKLVEDGWMREEQFVDAFPKAIENLWKTL